MYITDLLEEDAEIAIKVVIVGNGAVGKSSMIQKYCRGIFTAEYKKTIGVDFLEKRLSVQGEDVRLMLWDTAGQEEFDCITRAYYRGAQACVIAFSTTDRDSFYQVRRWKKKVEEECGSIPMVLVQNKMDLLYNSQVDSFEVDRLACCLGMRLIKTSVRENLNVNKVFHWLAECQLRILARQSQEYSLIQIGAGGLTSISQSDFLSQYERSWTDQQTTKRRRKHQTRDQIKQLCDTRAFFLAPHTTKHTVKHSAPTLCKRL